MAISQIVWWGGLTLLLLSGQHTVLLAQELHLETLLPVTAAGQTQSGAFSLISNVGAAEPTGDVEGGRFSMVSGGRLFFPAVPAAPAVTHAPPAGAPAGRDLVLTWEVASRTGVRDARLLYRPGGASTYAVATASQIEEGRFASTVPADAVTSEGVAYYMLVTDSSSQTVRSPAEGYYAAPVEVGEPGLVQANPLPGGTDASAYRLISMPLNLADKDPSAALRDDLGPYGNEHWRFFELLFDQTTREYPDTAPMAPGRAFWIISREPVEAVDTGAGRSVDLAEPYALALHPRWNLVGNPFSFPMPVENVVLGSSQPVELRSYVGGWNDPIGARVTVLQPFSGYALFNPSAIVDTLYIDPRLPETPDTSSQTGAHVQSSPVHWSIRIRAQSRRATDADNVAAVAHGAASGWDPLDYPEPPTVGSFVSVYFPHPEWGRLSEHYSTDVRSASSEGEVWTFEVASNIDTPVRLTFDGIGRLPTEREAWLVDDVLAVSQDLRLAGSYALSRPAADKPRRLRLLVGSAEFIDQQLLQVPSAPRKLELRPAFPNPFRSGTTIPYALPAPSHVSLKVFSVTGRVVATLVDAPASEGYHSVVWDGRGIAGKPLSSGVYFLRLQAGGAQLTRPIIIAQ